jgi:hypothetical protein
VTLTSFFSAIQESLRNKKSVGISERPHDVDRKCEINSSSKST